jgi:hypothetical protein
MAKAFSKRDEYLLKTAKAICRSPAVHECLVGITAHPNVRRLSYRAEKMPHFVILSTALTAKRSLEIEAALDNALKRDKDSKYHSEKKGHRKGLGGRKAAKGNCYSVYLAWY